MNLTSFTKRKARTVTLAAGVLAVVMLITFYMGRVIRNMDQSIESVFADRLQPAVDLVFISENLFKRRMVVEDYLTQKSPKPHDEVIKLLASGRDERNTLIHKFEKTKLTREEADELQNFKTLAAEYDLLEKEVLRAGIAGGQPEAADLFGSQGDAIFRKSISSLHHIAQIQSSTGGSIVKSVHQQAAGIEVNATLLLGLCILSALLVLKTLRTDRLADRKSDYFHLN